MFGFFAILSQKTFGDKDEIRIKLLESNGHGCKHSEPIYSILEIRSKTVLGYFHSLHGGTWARLLLCRTIVWTSSLGATYNINYVDIFWCLGNLCHYHQRVYSHHCLEWTIFSSKKNKRWIAEAETSRINISMCAIGKMRKRNHRYKSGLSNLCYPCR